MRPTHLKHVLREIVLKTNITPLIWGSRGIGKSQIVYELSKNLGKVTGQPWGFVDLRISTQEISDLTGIPRAYTWKAVHADTGREAVITETDWSVPVWFPTAEKIAQKGRDVPANGIIFLDEINRGGPQETQAIFQFVLDRRIHTHVLAPGWKIVAAANPPTEEYLVNEFDAALLDRFLQLTLKPSTADWLEWAASPDGDICAVVARFIDTHPEMLCEISETEHSWSPVVTSSPRAWEIVNTIMKKCRLSPEVVTEVYTGLVGNAAAIALVEFLKNEYEKPVQGWEIMKNYPEVQEKVRKICEKNRLDVLNIIMQDVIKLANTKPEDFNVQNFYLFLMDLRNDLKVTLVHALSGNDKVYPLMNGHEELFSEITRILHETEKEQQAATT